MGGRRRAGGDVMGAWERAHARRRRFEEAVARQERALGITDEVKRASAERRRAIQDETARRLDRGDDPTATMDWLSAELRKLQA